MKRNFGSYPLWLRIWHWSNAFLFVTLLITGLSMHYSKVGPPPFGFRSDVLIHNTAGALLTLFYGLFLFGNLRLGNWRYYRVLHVDLIPGLLLQTRYYLWGIFVGSPHPYPENESRKFNPLQKLFYLAVMYIMFPVLAMTGWALFFPDHLPATLFGIPGIGLWDLVHTYTGFCLSLFMVVHVYLGTTGATPGKLFRLMWSGPAITESTPRIRPPESADEPGSQNEKPVTASKEHS